MHTIKVLAAGSALPAICLLLGRSLVAKVFIPMWLLGAGVNMWVRVTSAGYSVADEAPVFLAVFSIPAAVALFIIWRSARA